MNRTIRVLLVDDHVLVRKGITGLLATQKDIAVVGEAGDGLEAVAKARELRPDVVLMDLNMPGAGGLEATGQIARELPDVKVLVLTYSDNGADLQEAFNRGAVGYLLKDLDPEVLFSSLRRACKGEAPISSSMTAKFLEMVKRGRVAAPPPATPASPRAGQAALTEREREVLRLISGGATNRDIARALLISENTVKNHVRKILAKLNTSNRAQAVAQAIREGIING